MLDHNCRQIYYKWPPPSLRDKNMNDPREREGGRQTKRATREEESIPFPLRAGAMEPTRLREVYGECVRNHAARLGAYASDGCCEYTPDALHPNVMFCTACGCHRNFHRKVPISDNSASAAANTDGVNMRLGEILRARRRRRTKFTAEQKARMAAFAAQIGWKVHKQERGGGGGGEDEVSRFCKDIGITRQVFKIWIHNHKGSAIAATSSSNTSAAEGADGEGEGEGEGDGGMEGG